MNYAHCRSLLHLCHALKLGNYTFHVEVLMHLHSKLFGATPAARGKIGAKPAIVIGLKDPSS